MSPRDFARPEVLGRIRTGLLTGGALQGHDWETHHFHYFDWTHQAFALYRSFPFFMTDAWVTPNFVANAEAPSLGPFAWLLFGGFFASHVAVGHHWAMGAWLLPGLVWLARRAVLGSNPALCAAAAVNAFTILGGQHQPFIWQNLVLGAYALLLAGQRRSLAPVSALGAASHPAPSRRRPCAPTAFHPGRPARPAPARSAPHGRDTASTPWAWRPRARRCRCR